MKLEKKIGFIGTGQMATAIAAGIIKAELVDSADVYGYDLNPASAENFHKLTGGTICSDNIQVLEHSDIVFLAVKPQQIDSPLTDIHFLPEEKRKEILFISIAAGITLSVLEDRMGSDMRIVRVMPNTPCLVKEAASGFAISKGTTMEDAETVNLLLGSLGIVHELPEKLLDAVTGLSGSGPAFVFLILEALADGGVKMGLPRNVALELAAQTLKGSAEIYLKTKDHPGLLKDRVCSPGGTTIAGVAELENRGVRAAMIAAVEAATRRSVELGKK
ncbi:MAG: pyrroline-5-carboxylate reductase [Planctomycetia bacterium]|nr:pyrroline-5-carboxylate reductase [Planctomycetia bacterium]